MSPALPQPPPRPVPEGIPASALAARIDQFLASRGLAGTAPREGSPAPSPVSEGPAEFVCEEDVREAIKAGRKLVIGERTILTPSARDLGEANKVFLQAEWR